MIALQILSCIYHDTSGSAVAQCFEKRVGPCLDERILRFARGDWAIQGKKCDTGDQSNSAVSDSGFLDYAKLRTVLHTMSERPASVNFRETSMRTKLLEKYGESETARAVQLLCKLSERWAESLESVKEHSSEESIAPG